MRMAHKVRDPVHGYIPFTSIEKEIIDTTQFQRLRGLKQLSNADLAYPGATHTRFSHSIGTMHVAFQMAEHLQIDKDKIDAIRLAALLHDLGHAPYSHVFEEAIKSLPGYSFDHEVNTIKIISDTNELSNCLEEPIKKDVLEILIGNSPSLSRDIITSSLDADRMDYLLRDSYYCGVEYGKFDLERILFCLESIQDGVRLSLCIKHNGVHAVDNLRLARYGSLGNSVGSRI